MSERYALGAEKVKPCAMAHVSHGLWKKCGKTCGYLLAHTCAPGRTANAATTQRLAAPVTLYVEAFAAHPVGF